MIEELYDFGKDLHHLIDLGMLPKRPFVIDAGACVGKFCGAMTEVRPECEIVAIEPSRRNLPQLLERLSGMSNVAMVNAALASSDGKLEMHDVYGENGKYYQWSSTEKEMASKAVGRSGFERIDTFEIDAVSLETLMEDRDVDYLKMDIEGAEFDVIGSMTEELAARIAQMSLEYHRDCAPLVDKLESLGYEVLHVPENQEIYARRGRR